MKNTYGVVHLSFSVKCSYCNFYHSSQCEEDWFEENCPDLHYKNAGDFNETVECLECGKKFEIKEFEY